MEGIVPFAEVNGIEMYYERVGQGEPIVLITGLAGDVSFWNKTVPMLSDRFDVITVDNRGAGRTRCSGTFGIEDMADDVIALLDHLGIFKSNILGWSMGSHIALDLAARYPDRVRTLTIVACYLYRPARSAYILEYLADGYADGTVSGGTVAKVLNVLLRNSGFFEEAERKGRTIREIQPPDPIGFKNQMRAVNGYDAEKDASSIRAANTARRSARRSFRSGKRFARTTSSPAITSLRRRSKLMLFQKRIDRAMRYQKERNEAAELKKPTEEDKDAVSKKDLFAMILSAMLVILPVAILVLLGIAFGCYFLFFH